MIDQSRQITRATFLKHVNRQDIYSIETDLGYVRCKRQGLVMTDDWAVSYHKSKLHGRTVYYFMHSAIEYVFAQA